MSLDELKEFTAELQSIFDRVTKPDNLEENDGAGTGLLILRYGLLTAAYGLIILAGSTGCDIDEACALVMAQEAEHKNTKICVSSEAAERARWWIRKRAEDPFHPDSIATKVEGIQ